VIQGNNLKYQIFIIILFSSLLFAQNFPQNPADLKEPISQQCLTEFMAEVEKEENIEVIEAGKSAANHPLYLVHFLSTDSKDPVRILFYGQQHGNEPAGKDALLYLARLIQQRQFILSQTIDLWIIPQLNPDGAVKNQRYNSNDVDLNRDHFRLSQPETQMLHQIVRKIRPHVAVDCHEFTRDSRDYLEKGWYEWPQIMMDAMNNPLFSSELREI
jgi:predicted deacylase